MDDLSEVEDVRVPGGFVIPAELMREQIRWAQRTGHANCFFQKWTRLDGMSEKIVVTIVDLFDDRWPTKSVTNDAEFVVDLAVKRQGDHPLVYLDTEGNWDELRHVEGVFACHRSLQAIDVDDAISKVLALHELDAQEYGGRQ